MARCFGSVCDPVVLAAGQAAVRPTLHLRLISPVSDSTTVRQALRLICQDGQGQATTMSFISAHGVHTLACTSPSTSARPERTATRD